MKYDWEDELLPTICDISCCGRAWANVESVEGALHFAEEALPPLGTLARCDILKDIMGDAERVYEEALAACRASL